MPCRTVTSGLGVAGAKARSTYRFWCPSLSRQAGPTQNKYDLRSGPITTFFADGQGPEWWIRMASGALKHAVGVIHKVPKVDLIGGTVFHRKHFRVVYLSRPITKKAIHVLPFASSFSIFAGCAGPYCGGSAGTRLRAGRWRGPGAGHVYQRYGWWIDCPGRIRAN